ncbi:unnamed protein product, partial [Trichobilharzia regenti]
SVWAQYFNTNGINAIFWSATLASEQVLGKGVNNKSQSNAEQEEKSDEVSEECEDDSIEDSTDSDTYSEASTVTLSGNISNEQDVCPVQCSQQPSDKLNCNVSTVSSSVNNAETSIESNSEVTVCPVDSAANVETCNPTQ